MGRRAFSSAFSQLFVGFLVTYAASCATTVDATGSEDPDALGTGRDAPAVDPAKVLVNGKKLGILILVTDLKYKGVSRVNKLRAAVRLAERNLLPFTPYIMYVFTLEAGLSEVRHSLSDLMGSDGHLHVLPIVNGTWEVPPAAKHEAWWKGSWNAAYRLMGDWRMTFAAHFAHSQGHRHMLFMDDDSFITGEVGQDLVALFDSRGLDLGAHRFNTDTALVTWGLPELARFFLLVHGGEPAGDLWGHCDPPSPEGLYSAYDPKEITDPELRRAAASLQLPRTGGWDRVVLNGNCLMVSLRWWFGAKVQAFVALARASGASFAFRWNEQAVIGMAARLFAPPSKVANFSFPYVHRGHWEDALRQGGLRVDAAPREREGAEPAAEPAKAPAQGRAPGKAG